MKKRRVSYLRKKSLSPEKAAKIRKMNAAQRSLETSRLRRGTVVKPPVFKEGIAAKDAGIEYLDGGQVAKTYTREVVPGKIEPYRRDVLRDIDTAIRQKRDMLASLELEIKREEKAANVLRQLHAKIKDRWSKMAPEEKKNALSSALGIIDLLQERHKRSRELDLNEIGDISRHKTSREQKSKAIQGLHGAIKKLREGNPGAASAILVGTFNSLVAQANELMGQASATARDRDILVKEAGRRENIIKGFGEKIYPKERLTGLKKWAPGRKLRLAEAQLGLLEKNIEKWHAKASPKQRANMLSWLNAMQYVLRGISGPITKNLEASRKALKGGEVRAAGEKMGKALKEINSKLNEIKKAEKEKRKR